MIFESEVGWVVTQPTYWWLAKLHCIHAPGATGDLFASARRWARAGKLPVAHRIRPVSDVGRVSRTLSSARWARPTILHFKKNESGGSWEIQGKANGLVNLLHAGH